MNKLISFLVGFTLLSTMVACKPDPETPTPNRSGGTTNIESSDSRPGKVCPIGTPIGTVLTKTIGPEGGQLVADELGLTLTVPAGAVETAQMFSVQPITSTGPQSTGQSFRLSPHGTTFKKPVTITARYDPTTLIGTVPEALALAYQNSKGVWLLAAKGQVDTTAHTVSVETTHFSDWSVLKRALLLPEAAFVKPGETLVLTVSVLTEELFVPIHQEEEVPEPYESPSTFVDYSSWKLVGSGKLNPAGFKAAYIAPNALPEKNPVAVSIKLKGPTIIEGTSYQELWLVSNIYIGEEGLTYRINGGKWIHTIAGFGQGATLLSTTAASQLNITTGGVIDGKPVGVNIMTPKPDLTSSADDRISIESVNRWTTNGLPLFTLSDRTDDISYAHYYKVGKNIYPSPGTIVIHQFGPVGQYVTGNFELTKAGKTHPTKGFMGTAHIEGFFRVKRVEDRRSPQ